MDIVTDVALDEIAGKLRSIVDEHGPRSIAIYSSSAAYFTGGNRLARALLTGLTGWTSYYTAVTIDAPAKGAQEQFPKRSDLSNIEETDERTMRPRWIGRLPGA